MVTPESVYFYRKSEEMLSDVIIASSRESFNEN